MSYTTQVYKTRTTFVFNLTMKEFFLSLNKDSNFRDTIIDIFNDCEYPQVFWQFPDYEPNKIAKFQLIISKPFSQSNYKIFDKYFYGKFPGDIVTFPNLSGDALLISIVPLNKLNCSFSDIMAFMRGPHHEIKHNLLKRIGFEMTNNKVGTHLSTHGHGVSWLHIRICTSPKYYV